MFRSHRRLIIVSIAAICFLAGAPAAHALVSTTPASTWQANGRVDVIIRAGSKIYIGGDFTSLFDHSGGSVTRSRVAALDAATGAPLSWNPGANSTVYAMALSPGGSTLYIGGTFTSVGGTSRNRVAAFDVATGALLPFSSNVQGGGVRALAASSSTVYLGGAFDHVDGTSRVGLAAIGPVTGGLTAWYPGAAAGGRIRTLSLPMASRLVIGGSFDSIGGAGGQNITAADPVTGALQPWNSHPNDSVIAMTSAGGFVYAGTRNNLANRYDPTTGGLKFSKHGNGNVQAVAVLDGVLYIGGHFQDFAGQEEPHLAAADATSGATIAWNASANSTLGVFALCGDGDLYMGGDFTSVSNQQQARFAMFEN